MISSALLFQINKCSNTTLKPGDLPCKSDEEIDRYVERVQVETWTTYQKVDFGIWGSTPMALSEKYQVYNLLEAKRRVGNLFTIKENQLQAEDGWI